MLLKMILEKWFVVVWTGFFWLEIETSGGFLVKGRKPPGSIKFSEIHE
jgi:hypothetical protein